MFCEHRGDKILRGKVVFYRNIVSNNRFLQKQQTTSHINRVNTMNKKSAAIELKFCI